MHTYVCTHTAQSTKIQRLHSSNAKVQDQLKHVSNDLAVSEKHRQMKEKECKELKGEWREKNKRLSMMENKFANGTGGTVMKLRKRLALSEESVSELKKSLKRQEQGDYAHSLVIEEQKGG